MSEALYGVDGCRAGWIVARASGRLDEVRFAIERDLAAIFEAAARGQARVAIDIPIGLPQFGPRACDTAARRQLGPRASSVFPAPSRAALASPDDYGTASHANASVLGARLSRQSFHLLRRIRDIDGLLVNVDAQARVHEAHPELAFAVLAGRPLPPKKTRAGVERRLQVLRRNGLGSLRLRNIRARLGFGHAAEHDIIDAAVCLVVARRIDRGEAVRLGGREYDERRLRMEIFA